MNMKKILSFIIPAYNSQHYIRKCLESFAVPAVLAEIEILIVNDGSTDKTAEIAGEYVQRYPDSYHILTKANGGHGSAINEGVRLAAGTYIKVVDSDDWILSGNLPGLVDRLRGLNAQVVITPYHTVDMKTELREFYGLYCPEFDRPYSLREVAEHWREFENGVSLHGIIYGTEFYRKYGIKLIEHVFYEDQEYAAIPFCRADSVVPLNVPLYQYLIGNDGQSVSVQNQIKRAGHMEAVIRHMAAYFQSRTEWEEAQKCFIKFKFEGFILNYYKLLCILVPDRKWGRRHCREVNKMICSALPQFRRSLVLKSAIFQLLGWAGINERQYRNMLNHSLYQKMRKKPKREMDCSYEDMDKTV